MKTPQLVVSDYSTFKRDGSTLRRLLRDAKNILVTSSGTMFTEERNSKTFVAVLITYELTQQDALNLMNALYLNQLKEHDQVLMKWLPLNNVSETMMSEMTDAAAFGTGALLRAIGAQNTPVIEKAYVKLLRSIDAQLAA